MSDGDSYNNIEFFRFSIDGDHNGWNRIHILYQCGENHTKSPSIVTLGVTKILRSHYRRPDYLFLAMRPQLRMNRSIPFMQKQKGY